MYYHPITDMTSDHSFEWEFYAEFDFDIFVDFRWSWTGHDVIMKYNMLNTAQGVILHVTTHSNGNLMQILVNIEVGYWG